ncbi:MAG: GNAT family N-acetyltransferase [Chloroflexi bacterium]|nr:GNAT family N-acetyltransferase [Chloroflexota bacterium]
MIIETIYLPDAPAIPGLVFRPIRGEAEYPALVDLFNAAIEEDKTDELYTVESLANDYAHLDNCDLSTDMLLAEVDGQLVGSARVWWWVNDAGERLYGVTGQVHPQWRGRGIGRALLHWEERRAREIAATHPIAEPRYFQAWIMETQVRRMALLKHAGYTPIRYGFMMVRPNLADVPDEWPMPEGLEVRPVLPEHHRAIWEALQEAFRDHWGHRPGTEEEYLGWLNWPDAQPHLWQVAWDAQSNEVAGMVLNSIFENENERFGVKRGWTDPICVRRPWRRRGLARALIMHSMKLLRDLGMTEAALGVDAENPNKALHLYESCGYRPVKRSFTMRKTQ